MLYLLNPLHGTMGRGRWWLMQVAIFVLAIVAMFGTAFAFADFDAPAGTRNASENLMLALIILGVFYMNLATCVNRLRDSGRSAFWYLTFLLPMVGTGLMIYFCGLEAGQKQAA
ncbi:DUF805 domain-containing protein [Amylibacter sp. IMCC11727]|uniref:DUF805 domain-containing protein n=1 Tax=Amylibacter sp. IMCC11727 TaxID=3039851 RepID=UPI00244E103B|nr:DUF805 domain-containing protein [Amylibacter sp. IMCC11727]WGI22474.1 DUF805 domain-containing protein [Amylibacter sp. IMCC11727]